jgi:hypothetical protein
MDGAMAVKGKYVVGSGSFTMAFSHIFLFLELFVFDFHAQGFEFFSDSVGTGPVFVAPGPVSFANQVLCLGIQYGFFKTENVYDFVNSEQLFF